MLSIVSKPKVVASEEEAYRLTWSSGGISPLSVFTAFSETSPNDSYIVEVPAGVSVLVPRLIIPSSGSVSTWAVIRVYGMSLRADTDALKWDFTLLQTGSAGDSHNFGDTNANNEISYTRDGVSRRIITGRVSAGVFITQGFTRFLVHVTTALAGTGLTGSQIVFRAF